MEPGQDRDTAPRYYVAPAKHSDDIRRMAVGLVLFFSLLIALAGGVIYFADRIVVHLPFALEKRFVRPYERLAGRFAPDPNGPGAARREAVENYLQTLADDLARQLQVPSDYAIQVHYLESETVNAFATLGGHVFVFRGLLAQMPDENSLAMVLAHEIAHIRHRDPAVAMGRGMALLMLASVISGDTRSGDVVLNSGQLGMLAFSREQEARADEVALSALHDRYGHVRGYDTLFAYLQGAAVRDVEEADTGDREEPVFADMREWLSTHPALDSRITALREQAARNNWPTEGGPHPLPEEVSGWLQGNAP